jgi:hypothetical protein
MTRSLSGMRCISARASVVFPEPVAPEMTMFRRALLFALQASHSNMTS